MKLGFFASLILVGSCASMGTYSTVTLENSIKMLDANVHGAPQVEGIPGDSHAEYLPKLYAAAQARGVEVELITFEVNVLEGEMMWGFYDGMGKLLIEKSLSKNEQVATIVHELGHHIAPVELDGTQDGQVFAEALSAIVCEGIGLDTITAVRTYFWKFPQWDKVLKRYSGTIDREAQQLLKELR